MRVEYLDLNLMDKKLIDTAIYIVKNAYAPFSGFKVGAAVLSNDNIIYSGVNVEISSYSPTICAERNAIFSMFSTGDRNFKKIAISSSGKDTFPCGVCRQVISELSPNCEVFIVNDKKDIKRFSIKELLPYSFKLEEK